MKPWVLTALLGVTLVVMVGIEEWRIGKLAKRVGELETQLAAEEAGPADPGRVRTMRDVGTVASRTPREASVGKGSARSEEREDGSLGTSLRRMAENPAGRAMMNQGIKAMSAMWYADLVRDFELSREEEEYFLGIVAGSMSGQQAIGMKMMGVKNDAEREALKGEMERFKEDEKQAMKEFLNDDDDYAAYEAYVDRLPERQQLDGLRAVMAEAEAPLSAEQESAVIDAMYEARTSAANATDWNGPGGMDAIAGGEAAKRFEEEWGKTAAATATAVGKVLDETQMAAFAGYQEQVKEMQMMGIRMAEKMFQDQQGRGDGE